MYIPRIVEAELANDTTLPWGSFFPKGSKVLLTSELKDPKYSDCLVALPNPVPAYLAIVEESLGTAISLREGMFGQKSVFPPSSKIFTEIKLNEFDEYFQVVTALTIFSFIALEAWCNQIIPESYVYLRKRKNKCIPFIFKSEKLSKLEIQRRISLDNKLDKILPEVVKKQSLKKTPIWKDYITAKKIRDDFTHLKSPEKLSEHKTNYDPFFQVLLNTDFEMIAKLPRRVMFHFIPEGLGF